MQNNDLTIVQRGLAAYKATMLELRNYTARSTFIPLQGRWYMYTDNRWVTCDDANYGANYYQFKRSGGVDPIPNYRWNLLGLFLPKGTRLKALHFTCTANSSQVSDIKVHAIMKYPNPASRWETGLDHPNEYDLDVLCDENFRTSAMTGSPMDLLRRTFEFTNKVMQEDGYVILYIKPIGSLSSTRYLRTSWTWEVVSP